MKLKLKRPLAFFDLETTGTNIGADRIVEISVIKLNPDGSEEVKTWRVHPGIPIPLESSLVHNSNKFDIPMIMEEFLRAGVSFSLDERHFVDVQNIFHQMEQRTLKAAYQFYCNKVIENAHSAEADTRATMEVLLAQIERYENVEWEDKKGNKLIPVVGDVEALHVFTNLSKPVDFAGRMVYNEQGEELINFGKHKGKRVEDVLNAEPSYYSWMMQGDFPLYTKRKLEEIYTRWNAKKTAERQANKAAQPKPADQQPAAPKPEFQKKEYTKPDHTKNQQYQNKPFKKKDEPAQPVNDDMLAQLALKFKKG
jgi:DNA polymerase-3 subunit epsilon